MILFWLLSLLVILSTPPHPPESIIFLFLLIPLSFPSKLSNFKIKKCLQRKENGFQEIRPLNLNLSTKERIEPSIKIPSCKLDLLLCTDVQLAKDFMYGGLIRIIIQKENRIFSHIFKNKYEKIILMMVPVERYVSHQVSELKEKLQLNPQVVKLKKIFSE